MAFLLNMRATGKGSHGAEAKPTTGNPRVKIAGSEVLTVATQFTVQSCSNVVASSPFPCVIAMFPQGATRVKVGGMAVLLDSSTATILPTGVTLEITNPQKHVKGE